LGALPPGPIDAEGHRLPLGLRPARRGAPCRSTALGIGLGGRYSGGSRVGGLSGGDGLLLGSLEAARLDFPPLAVQPIQPLRPSSVTGGSGPAGAEGSPTAATAAALVPPPFFWVPAVELIGDFEVSGAHGEVVSKVGSCEEPGAAAPIAGTLRMVRGGMYLWTVQILRQNPQRPCVQFGVCGPEYGRPWRLISTSRCSRSRDEGPWLPRPAGDFCIGEGDSIHCQADLRGLVGPFGSFSFAVNDGPLEVAFEDLPLADGSAALRPALAIGGGGTTCRLIVG